MKVKVYGTGCPKCKKLYEEVKKVVEDVEYITEIDKIIEAGIMSTPALVVNDQVVCVGRIPSEEEIKEYIEDGQSCSTCSCGGGCCN